MSHDLLQSYRDDVVENLMSLSENGWWKESPVPMLVLAPFHVEERYLAHWIMLRICEGKYLSCDSHVISPTIQLSSPCRRGGQLLFSLT